MTNSQKLLSMYKAGAAPMASAGPRVKKPAAPAAPAAPQLGATMPAPGAVPGAAKMPIANPVTPKTAPAPAKKAAGFQLIDKVGGEAEPAAPRVKIPAPVGAVGEIAFNPKIPAEQQAYNRIAQQELKHLPSYETALTPGRLPTENLLAQQEAAPAPRQTSLSENAFNVAKQRGAR